MKAKYLVVKYILATRYTDDKKSMYTPIIFHVWDNYSEEYVLHLRNDKNDKKLVFSHGDVWEGLKLAQKSSKKNTLQMQDVEMSQRVGTIKSYELVGEDQETKTRAFRLKNSVRTLITTQLGLSKFFSVTFINMDEPPKLYRLTKEQIFQNFYIILTT